MWEWFVQKTTEIVRMRYTTETIRSTNRDDVVQEVIMYLIENKDYAERIYEQKSVAMLYRVVMNTIYRLKANDSFLDYRQNSLLTIIHQKCDEYNIEPAPQNAYKIVAVLWNTMNISDTTKVCVCNISKIEELLKADRECGQITEMSFNDMTEAEMVKNHLL